MAYALTEEQELIQQNAREFAEDYIKSNVEIMEKNDKAPESLIQQMIEQDFLGIFLSSEYGGADAGFLSYILIIEEIARVNGATAAILMQHAALVEYIINELGTDDQKEKFLPNLCQGKMIGSFAFSEKEAAPGMGTEKVTAIQQDNNYILNGKKYYVGNGDIAGLFIVFAQTDTDIENKKISAFIVDASSAGIEIKRNIPCMGLKGYSHSEILFNNVRVPNNNMLGESGAGFDIAEKAQSVGNIAACAIILGIAQAAVDDAINYAKERIQFKRAIINFPAIQNMLALAIGNIHTLRLSIYDAANLIDQDKDFKTESAIIKLLANNIGQQTLEDVIQIEGGYGYSQDMPASRFFRDIHGLMRQSSSLEFPEKIIAEQLIH